MESPRPDELPAPPPSAIPALAAQVITQLTERGLTLATAESLTGGLVCARLVDVPGSSAVVRGGVVAYATELKHRLLGVDAALLAEHGAVHPEVARQLGTGVRDALGADYGLATTGVAGPSPQDGHQPGTVFVAVARPAAGACAVRALRLSGDRARIRAESVAAVLELLLEVLAAPRPAAG
jgi:nicotinamide-nucleotide amidase